MQSDVVRISSNVILCFMKNKSADQHRNGGLQTLNSFNNIFSETSGRPRMYLDVLACSRMLLMPLKMLKGCCNKIPTSMEGHRHKHRGYV